MLIKGADLLVDGAASLGRKFNISEIIIGLTIVSIGTSMPELFVSTTSAMIGSSDMAIGNIIGSNLCNLLLILGLSTIIMPIEIKKETRIIEVPMCLAVTIIFAIMCNTGDVITRIEGIVLIFLFILFLIYTIVMAKKGNDFDKEDDLETSNKEIKELSTIKSIIYIIIGIIALKIGGDFTVDNATVVAQNLGISEKIIGLTILAIGTSLPELITSVTAAIKKNSDIAIGNIIGSNIFNILLIIGTSGVITNLVYNVTYNLQFIILIIAMIVLALFPCIPPKNKMSRGNGIVYVLMYIVYMITLIII